MDTVTFKDWVTMGMAFVALCVSLFNLYWGTFRRRIALFFIQGNGMKYVLVNGGKSDILVQEVKYWWSGKEKNARTAPGQSTSVQLPVLLKAGTALEHDVTFVDLKGALENLHQYGRDIEDSTDQKALDVTATIKWTDINGESHFREVPIADTRVGEKFIHQWLPKNYSSIDLSPVRRRVWWWSRQNWHPAVKELMDRQKK